MGLAEKWRDFIGYEREEAPYEQPRVPRAARQIVLLHLALPEDAKRVVDALVARSLVVFSVEGTSRAVARRLVDFIGGAAFTKDGQIRRIGANTYLLTPYDVTLIERDEPF